MTLNYPQDALLELERGNVVGAVELLTNRISSGSSDQASLHLIGHILMLAKKYDAAFEYLQQATKAGPKNEIVFFSLGTVAGYLGKLDICKLNFQEALSANPNNLALRLDIGRILKAFGCVADAIKCFDETLNIFPDCKDALTELQTATKDLRVAREDKYFSDNYRNYGPILFITQGRSAGDYALSEMLRRLNTFHIPDILTLWYPIDSILDPAVLKRHQKIGGIVAPHLYPLTENFILLKECGVKKLVVNIREPRQGTYSMARWIDEIGARKFPYEVPLLYANLPQNYFSLPFEEKLDHVIEWQLPQIVNFIDRWRQAGEDSRWGFQVHFSKFEVLKTDYDRYFREILDFYGIDFKNFEGEAYVSKPGESGRAGEHSFMRGLIDEWRTNVSDKQKVRMNELTPQALLDSFGWTR